MELRKIVNMKINNQITLTSKAANFGIQKNADNENKYHKYPLKYLAYCNDFGIALRPITGNFISALSWIPTISYIALAANHSAKNSNSSKNSKEKFKKELFFQCSANLALPFILIETSKLITEKLLKKGLNKMTKVQKNLFNSVTSILILLASVKKIDGISDKMTNYFFKNQNYDRIRNNE